MVSRLKPGSELRWRCEERRSHRSSNPQRGRGVLIVTKSLTVPGDVGESTPTNAAETHRGTIKSLSTLMRTMALPLAFAIAAAPAKADLARGEAEFLRGNAHCDAREFSDALASYHRAAAFGYEDHVMWNNRGVALAGPRRHEGSIQAYTRRLQRNPKYEIAAYNLG